jgi:hypothetical protein
MSIDRGSKAGHALFVLFIALAVATATVAPMSAQTCAPPDAPNIIFTPPGAIGVGQTYSVVWSDVANLDAGGSYVIERSTEAGFGLLVDSQQTVTTSASFIAAAEGTLYHRVRAVAGCDSSKVSVGVAVAVIVVAATPNVVFSVQPAATVVAVGDSPSARVSSFVIENLTKSSVTVAVPSAPLASPQFFTIVDPQGELAGSGSVTLSPRQPRRLEIHFLNVPTTSPISYQGFIFLAGQPDSLAVTPYAFVNLKVGANESVAPVFWFQGAPSEYAFFSGYSTSQPDSARTPITIQIENPGTTPMDLGAEIAPDVWLIPTPGWNANPIPPKQKIDVQLAVDRSRALAGAALPRYTYLTVRSKGGKSARLTVQDNDVPPQSAGRPPLAPAVRSYVVAQVVAATVDGGRKTSRVRISNVSGAGVNADLFFTPEGVDGGDAVRVLRATIVVPPNDVVTLTDPLTQVFGLPSPAVGQIEVRGPADKIDFLTVTSEVFVPLSSGGAFSYALPVAKRGEGARLGSAHGIGGVPSGQGIRRTVVLAETSGIDTAAGRIIVYDQDAKLVGNVPYTLLRNGELQIDDIVSAAGGGAGFSTGRLDVIVDSGSGSVMANLVIVDVARQSAAVIASQPSTPQGLGKHLLIGLAVTPPPSYVIPGVVNGASSATPSVTFATAVGLTAPSGVPATFGFTYLDALGFTPTVRPLITIDAGKTLEVKNVLENLFNLPPGTNAHGTLIVDVSTAAPVAARVTSGDSAGRTFGALPVITKTSEALTAALSGMRRPVFIDGLEQSVDPTRGRTWDLLVSELAGKSATITVRLFEAANRTSAIAERTFTLASHQQLRLASVFSGMGLDTDDRRKDRTNVEAMVIPESGDGTVVAAAISTDNRTLDRSTFLLTPSGGVPASGVSKVAPVTKPAATPRRRAARH